MTWGSVYVHKSCVDPFGGLGFPNDVWAGAGRVGALGIQLGCVPDFCCGYIHVYIYIYKYTHILRRFVRSEIDMGHRS